MREWDEDPVSDKQFWKETDGILKRKGSIKSTLYTIQDQTRDLMRMIEEPVFRLEDEESERVEQERNLDHARDNNF